ncbi:hypothetical protein [[Limnothrix rosea] IAM M-220]|uniref:hypothetical protein n=1 Tax=[Limnothrix rosea] IAM M-220 TaxID=454133 RepID=UPI00095A5E74|nr:hypothetical protein [[Limnothrix rosea] IAM M-220]OKH18762.1 hypothetical protein NIES208_04705 [[Limnothrix rosea] IAM M-220]
MSADNLKPTSQTNWEALESISDEDIDYSDIPPLTESFFAEATLKIPANKANNFIELDSDILQWLHNQNQEPKDLVNSLLRQYIQTQAL